MTNMLTTFRHVSESPAPRVAYSPRWQTPAGGENRDCIAVDESSLRSDSVDFPLHRLQVGLHDNGHNPLYEVGSHESGHNCL